MSSSDSTGSSEGDAGGAALPEVTYAFTSRGAAATWRVTRMILSEGLSELYQATLDLACDDREASPDPLLGERCLLTLSRGRELRRLCGVACRVEDFGVDRASRVARVVVVPDLWRLSQRVDSRVFQDMDAPSIVQAVLAAAGVPPDSLRAELKATYRKREFCVQYRETDLAFVQRLLEDEGITFRFDHAGEAEALVLVDEVTRFPDLPEPTHATVPLAGESAGTMPRETLRRLDVARQLNPTGVTLRDWDYRNPAALENVLTNPSPVSVGPREIYDQPAEYALSDWNTGGGGARYGARLAGVRVQEQRAQDLVARGSGNVTGFVPGAAFTLTDHRREDMNRRLLLTRVEHEGVAPDESRGRAAGAGERYANRFSVVDAQGPWRPRRVTARPRIHGAQTAVVVGPAGEEVYTDPLGRIKVLFHWDRLGATDERASCWVRVAQTWAGGAWGAQFIPRVGMEVVVTFLEGNPDRPLVTGCVYNGSNAPPFELPGDKTRSGLRTRSSLGGDGFNELSFQDLQGHEQVYLHAQRDLEVVAERDGARRAGRDERAEVGRDQRLRVGGDQELQVAGSRSVEVAVDSHARVLGNREVVVAMEDTQRVSGARFVSSLDSHVATKRNESTRVGGDARREVLGGATELVKDDKTLRVEGNLTAVVGRHDALRTFLVHAEGRAVVQSSDHTEIASEKELILRVGATRIRLTPERLELSSGAGLTLRAGNTVVEVTPDRLRLRSPGKLVASADSVSLLTDAAQVKLTEEVKITGAKVKLNPPKTEGDADAPAPPKPPTRMRFKDDEGRPLAGQRFVIRFSDGSEVAGVLDHEGRAQLELEGSGAKVTFPDVSDATPG